MALRYADGTYRDGEATLSDVDLTARRDQQVDAWADELGRMARDLLGAGELVVAIEFPLPRIEAFAARFLTRVSEIVTSAYVYAAGGLERVTDAGWQTVAGLVDAQQQFGRGFLDDLRAGRLSGRQAQARAGMYAHAATNAFERGKAALHGIDLPAMPGDQCEGLSRCRCSWSYDTEDGRTVATWIAAGDANTCAWCAVNADRYAPFRPEVA